MTVTKQQQLEWLANNFVKWPSIDKYLGMSCHVIGGSGGSHFITREEWQHELDKMHKQDNSWHERGELPPVGSECEVMHNDSLVKCEIIAHFKQKASMVAAYTVDYNGCKQLDSCIAEHFRPLRTEREKAIDALIEIICAGGELSKDGSAAREIAERIYEAQQTKEQTKEQTK